MQTFLVHENCYESAESLDPKRLFSQIYEGIHILASLLNKEGSLVNPKRSVRNHPASSYWVGHERGLYIYTQDHFLVWSNQYGKDRWDTINYRNLNILRRYLTGVDSIPESLIRCISDHRRALLVKDPEFYLRKQWPEVREYKQSIVADHYGIEV